MYKSHNTNRSAFTLNLRHLTTLSPLVLASVLAAGCSSESNSEIAEEVVIELARGNTDVIDKHFADNFVDNVGTTTAGAEELTQAVEAEASAYPDADVEVYRVLSEGDLVFVHSHLVLTPGSLGIAVGDFYRFEDDKIVERWEGRQEVPATTASGNDMFSTLSAPQRLDPDPDVDTEATREVMNAFGFAIGVEKDLTAWDTFVEPPYYQHSTNTANGAEAVSEVWGPIIVDPATVITPVLDLAEGDLYATLNLLDSPDLQLLTIDISRVRNGKILEHWDVVQPLD